MERIVDGLLKRGHKSSVIEKIMGANFKRVFGEIWTA
jgi:membrane dipeptidase